MALDLGPLLSAAAAKKRTEEDARQFDALLPIRLQELELMRQRLAKESASVDTAKTQSELDKAKFQLQLPSMLEAASVQQEIMKLRELLGKNDPKDRPEFAKSKAFELERQIESLQGRASLPPLASIAFTTGSALDSPTNLGRAVEISTGQKMGAGESDASARAHSKLGVDLYTELRAMHPTGDFSAAFQSEAPGGFNIRKGIEIAAKETSMSEWSIQLDLLGKQLQQRGQDIQFLIAQMQGDASIQAAFASSSGERAEALVKLFKAPFESANDFMAHMEKVGELMPELRGPMGNIIMNLGQLGVDMVGYGTQLRPDDHRIGGGLGLVRDMVVGDPGATLQAPNPGVDWNARAGEIAMSLMSQGASKEEAITQAEGIIQQEQASYQQQAPPLAQAFRSLAGGGGGGQPQPQPAPQPMPLAPDPQQQFPQSPQPGGMEAVPSHEVLPLVAQKALGKVQFGGANWSPNKVAGETNIYAAKWDDWFLNTAVPLLKLPPTLVEEYLSWNTNQRMSFAAQFAKEKAADLQKAAIDQQGSSSGPPQ